MVNAKYALSIIEEFKDETFSNIDIIERAEEAYKTLKQEKIIKDLHNTSKVEIEKLIDKLLALHNQSSYEIQKVIDEINPNLLAFLFARVQNACHYFYDLGDAACAVPSRPISLCRWAFCDLWDKTPDSPDLY